MPRQNAATTGSAVNLRAAAQSIRASASSGSFDDLTKALSQAASAFDDAQNAIEVIESRIRDLAQPNTNFTNRQAPMTVSGDRIRGGVQVQGLLLNVMGQGVDYTFGSQVGSIVAYDHGAGTYLALDIDGSPLVLNGRSGAAVAIGGTVTLATPLPVTSGGTGTTNGSITGTGSLTFTAGTNGQAALISNGTGKVVLKPGTDATTAIQLQNAAGTAILDVDTTNKAVGIGVTPSGVVLDVGSGTTNSLARFSVYNATTASATVLAAHARGTIASPTTLATGDFVGSFIMEGYDGANYQLNAAVSSQVVGAVSAGVVPTDLLFFTSPTNSAGLAEQLRITSAGKVKLGTLPPVFASNALAVAGGLAVGTLYRTGADPDPICIVH